MRNHIPGANATAASQVEDDSENGIDRTRLTPYLVVGGLAHMLILMLLLVGVGRAAELLPSEASVATEAANDETADRAQEALEAAAAALKARERAELLEKNFSDFLERLGTRAWSDGAAQAGSLVKQLGSPQIAERENAESVLLKIGPPAKAALVTGTHDVDPEIAHRSEHLLVGLREEDFEGRLQTFLEDTEVGADDRAILYRRLIFKFNKQIKDLESNPRTKKRAEVLKKNLSDFIEARSKQGDLNASVRFCLILDMRELPLLQRFLEGQEIGADDRANLYRRLISQIDKHVSSLESNPRAQKQAEELKKNLSAALFAAFFDEVDLNAPTRFCLILEIYELALAKDYAKAEQLIKTLESSFDEWVKESMESLQAKAFVYQFQEKWGQATKAWIEPVGRLQKKMLKTQDAKDKEDYCAALYEYNYCRVHYSIAVKDLAKKTVAIKGAVKVILSLESSEEGFGGESLKAKYLELVAVPEIKSEYERQKRAAAVAPRSE